MKEETIGKILAIVSKYVNNYQNSEIVDYYDLFGLDKSKTSDELSKSLKKLYRLLHPDNCAYLPEFMQTYYNQLLEEFGYCQDTFSNMRKREEYDKKLNRVNNTKKNTANEQAYSNNYQSSNRNNEQSYNRTKEQTYNRNTSQETNYTNNSQEVTGQDIYNVSKAMIETVRQEGLDTTIYQMALILMGKANWYDWTDRLNDDDVRLKLLSVGLEKYQKIVKTISMNTAKSLEDDFEKSKDCVINYFSYLYKSEHEFKELMYPFKNVCTETVSKYNSAQLELAIYNYSTNNFTKYFTNRNDARVLLEQNFNYKDALPFMNIYLNSFKDINFIYGYERYANIPEKYVIEMFVNKFFEEEIIKKSRSQYNQY